MKLLGQTQRLFLWAALPLFLVAGLVMYVAINHIFNDFAEEKLEDTKFEIEDYVRLHDSLPAFFQHSGARLEAVPMPDQVFLPITFSDTMLYNPLEDEYEPYKRIRFSVTMREQKWAVSVVQSTLEQEDIAAAVSIWLISLFALLFALLVGINHRISRLVWQPFFSTLRRMRNFSLTDKTALQLEETSVDEFRSLNHTLVELTEKIQQDYRAMKQFTENASHELQTPIAIIQNKVDLLLQQEQLSPAVVQHLHIIGQSTRRMARINQSLLLLSKIENDQFIACEWVDLASLIKKRLIWLEDFIAEKQLTVTTEYSGSLIEINPFLAETLVTNLLTNAVKHNIQGGDLDIRLDPSSLVICNTGIPSETPLTTLTGRFARGSSESDGLGLGLAIVQEICEKNGFIFSLDFENGTWKTSVTFKLQHHAESRK